MRIMMKSGLTAERLQAVVKKIFDVINSQKQETMPTAVNLYISLRRKDGVIVDPPFDWEITNEPYCHTNKKLLLADKETNIYIYPLEREHTTESD